MAEQVNELVAAPELPDRGGSFLFQPVGARPFVTPEGFSPEQRQFFRTGAEFAYRFANQTRLGLEVTHTSNAGLTRLNPGEQSVLLMYSIPWR